MLNPELKEKLEKEKWEIPDSRLGVIRHRGLDYKVSRYDYFHTEGSVFEFSIGAKVWAYFNVELEEELDLAGFNDLLNLAKENFLIEMDNINKDYNNLVEFHGNL